MWISPDLVIFQRLLAMQKPKITCLHWKVNASKLKEKPLIVDYHRPHGHNDGIAPYFREELRRYLSAKKPDRDDYSAWNIKQFRSDSTAWADDPLYG